ncbi:hypothetical protein BDV38DRAFT_283096 [Aspergillus pseudotamarii]|uniref:Uncharacterized protein n=1 Tax=Aspergillus pseudotamarii TaxID=132259 RepID=A0A5N6SRP5_ASPPS|nr:uncharacterized protein BDV38DRAFT_283096 [Aspergillus pseudotamarii]KAE8137255.1 hypothetical protein BDV38DRAFT_283096 [Aspergillus pseudotamarii]
MLGLLRTICLRQDVLVISALTISSWIVTSYAVILPYRRYVRLVALCGLTASAGGAAYYRGVTAIPGYEPVFGTVLSFLALRGVEILYLRTSPQNGHVPHAEGETDHSMPHPFRQGLKLLLDTRDVGNQFQCRNLPTFGHSNALLVPRKSNLLPWSIWTCLLGIPYVYFIGATYVMDIPHLTLRDGIPYIRLEDTTITRTASRAALSLGFWAVAYLHLQILYATVCMATILLFNYPEMYLPPLFGPLTAINSVRGFWG